MKMIPIKSSNIVAVGFDESKKELHIQFKGSTYIYSDVTPDVYSMFLQSGSKGQFLITKVIVKYESKRKE